MRFRWIIKAALGIGNIALLAFVLIFSYLCFFLPFLLIGLAGYVYFVLQTLGSADFQKEVSVKETLGEIKKAGEECSRLYKQSRRCLCRSLDLKVKLVLAEKEELLREFSKNRDDALKQKIAGHALNLTKAYIKLMVNFSVRCVELAEIDEDKIRDRINVNNCKLGFLKDPDTAFDLQKTIEMDRQLLGRVDEEKCELDKVSARLDYMESMIRMLKQRMMPGDCDEVDFPGIYSIVNEVAAFDNAVAMHKSNRLKA